MALSILGIVTLFSRKRGRMYEGDDVTPLEHALQCATLAEQAGAGLQGGQHDDAAAAAFIARPFAADAVQVRLWDDRRTRACAVTPPLAHFLPVLEAIARPGATG